MPTREMPQPLQLQAPKEPDSSTICPQGTRALLCLSLRPLLAAPLPQLRSPTPVMERSGTPTDTATLQQGNVACFHQQRPVSSTTMRTMFISQRSKLTRDNHPLAYFNLPFNSSFNLIFLRCSAHRVVSSALLTPPAQRQL